MGRRKTRKQKMVADSRHQLASTQTQQTPAPQIQKQQYSYAVETPRPTPSLIKTISPDYLQKDLKKTAILSISILAAELLLYFFLKSTHVALPFLNSY